jgi:hypothetical protein
LAGGLVIFLAIGVIVCSSVLLLLLIDSCISIIESNTNSGILFVVSYSSSSIISGDNNYIISISISLIGQYLNIMLYVVIGNAISS